MLEFIIVVRIFVSYMICDLSSVRRFEKLSPPKKLELMYSLCDNNSQTPPISMHQSLKQVTFKKRNLCSSRSFDY